MAQERRARHVVRKIDIWSVLKFSLVFFSTWLVVVLVAGVVLWAVASSAGRVEDIESLMKDLLGMESFEILGGELLRAGVLGGLIFVLLSTVVAGLMALLYNLISDVIGGVRVVVLEEEPAPVAAPVPRPLAPAISQKG